MLTTAVAPPEEKPSCVNLGYDAEKEGSVGSMDAECQEHGFDFGVAKWEYEDGEFKKESERSGYTTGVTGDDSTADWRSDPAVAGVLSKEALCYQYLPGGTSGTVTKIEYGISHITLCGEREGEVPEFGTVGVLAVLGLAGIFIYKRK